MSNWSEEKWFSMLNHIWVIHPWEDYKLFHRYAHGELNQEQKWSETVSPSFLALNVVKKIFLIELWRYSTLNNHFFNFFLFLTISVPILHPSLFTKVANELKTGTAVDFKRKKNISRKKRNWNISVDAETRKKMQSLIIVFFSS